MNSHNHKIDSDLVAVAIEKTLLDIGQPVLETIESRLKNEYNLGFSDCLDKPEYLNKILKDVFGVGHFDIVSSIKQNLDGANLNKPITEFLTVMCK